MFIIIININTVILIYINYINVYLMYISVNKPCVSFFFTLIFENKIWISTKTVDSNKDKSSFY